MWYFWIKKKKKKENKKNLNFHELNFAFKLEVTELTKTSNDTSYSLPIDFVLSLRNGAHPWPPLPSPDTAFRFGILIFIEALNQAPGFCGYL